MYGLRLFCGTGVSWGMRVCRLGSHSLKNVLLRNWTSEEGIGLDYPYFQTFVHDKRCWWIVYLGGLIKFCLESLFSWLIWVWLGYTLWVLTQLIWSRLEFLDRFWYFVAGWYALTDRKALMGDFVDHLFVSIDFWGRLPNIAWDFSRICVCSSYAFRYLPPD